MRGGRGAAVAGWEGAMVAVRVAGRVGWAREGVGVTERVGWAREGVGVTGVAGTGVVVTGAAGRGSGMLWDRERPGHEARHSVRESVTVTVRPAGRIWSLRGSTVLNLLSQVSKVCVREAGSGRLTSSCLPACKQCETVLLHDRKPEPAYVATSMQPTTVVQRSFNATA